jgi:hypothetical protein
MLSRRHRRRSWAYNELRHHDSWSMFRILATRWRPVAAELRNADAMEGRTHRVDQEERKTLPSCWSPWLLIK